MATKALSRPLTTPSLFDDFFKPWSEWFERPALFDRVITTPAINVKENKDHYTVSMAAPGLKKEDFKLDVEGNMLTISSEKEEQEEEKDEKYSRKEYSYQSFSRSFTLPEDVRPDAIEARYEDGVLNIRLPRLEDSKKRETAKTIVVK